jgi:asparagine synthase (glutamine-hydrolysing)
MCGIAGIVHGGNVELLKRMSAAQSHRGPDDDGMVWFHETRCGLAHKRLAIVDRTPLGHQPMSDAEERFWIIHNGEIFNHEELRSRMEKKGGRFRSRTDTEVILELYREQGAAALDRMNGMFAFAVYDSERDELLLARDRLGVKPLYYALLPGGIIFASEVKAILASGLIEAAPDSLSLLTPARYIVAPSTGFMNIMKLPPGHCLRFVDGRATIQQYWSIEPREEIPEGDVVSELRDILLDAARIQLTSDVPVGILLSGGIDSSLIAAAVRCNHTGSLHSFTVGMTPHDLRKEAMPADAPYAARLASSLGFTHHETVLEPSLADLLSTVVWHLDEPLADPAAINVYLLAREARQCGVPVLLTGMGGDEIFGGYRKHLACLKADFVRDLLPGYLRGLLQRALESLPVSKFGRGFRGLRWARRFMALTVLEKLERYLASDLSPDAAQFELLTGGRIRYHETAFVQQQRRSFEAASLSYLTRMCLNDTRFFLPDHNLLYSDKAAMAWGVETRQPLTDHRIVELMFSLPPEYRISRLEQKTLLKKVAAHLISSDIVHRPKVPFGMPVRSWLGGPLASLVDDILSEESLRKRGIYDAGAVRTMITRDRNGLEDSSLTIWTILTREIWLRTFCL